MLGVFGNAPECRDIEQMTELTMQKEEEGLGGRDQRCLAIGQSREARRIGGSKRAATHALSLCS